MNTRRKLLSLLLILFTANLVAQNFYSESSVKHYWADNGMDEIEGIYEKTGSYIYLYESCSNVYGETVCHIKWRSEGIKYKVALVKMSGEYKLIYLAGKPKGLKKVGGCNCGGISYRPPTPNSWRVGDLKAKLHKTATPNLFKCTWYMGDKSPNENAYITIESTYFKSQLGASDQDEDTYLKLYPTVDDNVNRNISKGVKTSGTGFALASNGIIVTNYHVVEGANSIKVRGVNSDFSKAYKARVLFSDKNNDLSLIKIDDDSFSSLGTVPIVLKTSLASVGENIFALGYPLRAMMGDEIKLTNGIISSKTGFQGDITSYQVSAPVQPGSSGGPLFDNNGYVIGIINAKLTIAENASYAVKSSFLKNLIELLDTPPKLTTYNSLSGISLAAQVKKVNKFVYIIEVE